MTPDDLGPALHLAGTCYPDYPEDAAVFAERLALSPEGCFVLECRGRLAGYLFSHAWKGAVSVPLNTVLGHLPDTPDRWYIHDLALAPALRGGGHARTAIALAENQARKRGLGLLSLTAIGPALPFWLSQGFASEPACAHEQAVLALYDANARLLTRRVDQASSSASP
ncbi:GNAT family N-acetyltransferase [Acetobacter garciniae]|nr:GNAT family N-acetyltransferase [Acetobacter garciniae]